MEFHTKLAVARVLGCAAFQSGTRDCWPAMDVKLNPLHRGVPRDEYDDICAAYRRGWRDAKVEAEWRARQDRRDTAWAGARAGAVVKVPEKTA